MGPIPEAIQAGLIGGTTKLAWVLVQNGVVREVGGALSYHALDQVLAGAPLPESLPWVVAIQSESLESAPVELKALTLNAEEDFSSDVVAWGADGVTNVLFFDASSTVKLLGATLERANGDAFLLSLIHISEPTRPY